jgi:nanoRNase/pAp phosphatase (c-di-AMP/oligoRNAs hydrolase)
VAVVTHHNPDPDAIAAGWGVVVLVEKTLKCPCRLYAGGAISRAENRILVDLLHPPLDLVDHLLPPSGTAVVVVDTFLPGLLVSWSLKEPLAAVIDHHARQPAAGSRRGTRHPRFRFRDIRPRVVATASMVSGYLKSAGIVPSPELATALLYGIHTDAQGWDVQFSGTDRAAFSWLSQYADPELRAHIERAPLPREHFYNLLLGLQNAFLYDDAALCFVPHASSPEVVGEVADLLLRCEEVDRVLCGAVVGDRMVFSARTSSGAGDAGELLVKTLQGRGSCGGHVHRAGGFIPLNGQSGAHELETSVRSAWLRACGIQQQRGARLVPKKEILKALD